MPTLLQLNSAANYGSIGKIAEQIGVSAKEQGWNVFLAYGRTKNPSQLNLIRSGSKINPYLHYAESRLFDREGLASRFETKRLIGKINTISPDIIHLHNIHDHWINYPILFKYLATIQTPIIWTFHDCWAFTGHCPHFENYECFKWRTICQNCAHQRKFSFDRSKENYILKKTLFTNIADRLTIVCVSEWLANYVRQSFLRGCRIEVINNGIDTSLFRCDHNVKKRNMVLGVSNIWPAYKGLADFIKLRELLPSNIEITIVGLTEQQVKWLPRGITGIARTSNVHELIALYNEAKVFVNPTYNDTFPTVNLEALACGTPVVTYRTGGSPEAVTENTGVIIEKGNVSELAHAVLQIMNGQKLFDQNDCRNRALDNFNSKTQYNKYLDIYSKLVCI